MSEEKKTFNQTIIEISKGFRMKKWKIVEAFFLVMLLMAMTTQAACTNCGPGNTRLGVTVPDNNMSIVISHGGGQISCKYPVHNLEATPNCSSPVMIGIDGNRYINTSDYSRATAVIMWGFDGISANDILKLGNASLYDRSVIGSWLSANITNDPLMALEDDQGYIDMRMLDKVPSYIVINESMNDSNWTSVYGPLANASRSVATIPVITLGNEWTYSSWINGNHDAFLIDIAKGAASYAITHPNYSEIDVSLFPDYNLHPGNVTDFKNAVSHIVQVLRDNDGTNIKFRLSYAVLPEGQSQPNLTTSYPGDAYIDHFQVDVLFGSILDPKSNWLFDSNVNSLFISLAVLNSSKHTFLDIGVTSDVEAADKCASINIDPQEVVEAYPNIKVILFKAGPGWDTLNRSDCSANFTENFLYNQIVGGPRAWWWGVNI